MSIHFLMCQWGNMLPDAGAHCRRGWRGIVIAVVMMSGAPAVRAGSNRDQERKKVAEGLSAGTLSEAAREDKQRAPEPPSPYRRGAWEFSLESSYAFQDIPAPLFLFAGRVYTSPYTYQLATQVLSARYQLTNPGGPWLLRGSWEGSAAIVGSAIVRGPENYFIGFALGLRYYFIQPGTRFVPYVEMRGGPGQTDSQGLRHAQQQDLAFTYLLGLGVRYDAGRHWSYTLSMIDQHLSNGYLATPNFGFDSVGVDLGAIWRF